MSLCDCLQLRRVKEDLRALEARLEIEATLGRPVFQEMSGRIVRPEKKARRARREIRVGTSLVLSSSLHVLSIVGISELTKILESGKIIYLMQFKPGRRAKSATRDQRGNPEHAVHLVTAAIPGSQERRS